jgi:hypothetical protein
MLANDGLARALPVTDTGASCTFAPRCAELRDFTARNPQTVEITLKRNPSRVRVRARVVRASDMQNARVGQDNGPRPDHCPDTLHRIALELQMNPE